MTALVLRWRCPERPMLTRWRGPDGSISAAAQAIPPTPIATVIGPVGPPGSQGQPLVHVQSAASAEWIVNHNRGFRPMITVLSAGGFEVEAEIVHASDNQARIYFNQPQSGSAIVR